MWTGTLSRGLRGTSTCADWWSDDALTMFGSVGRSDATNGSWTSCSTGTAGDNCSMKLSLICFEQ